MAPGSAAVVRRNPEALSALIDGEVMLMSVERSRYYALDAIASDIWNRLEQAPTQAQLIDELTAHYGGDRECIEKDTLDLLAELSAEGLIDISLLEDSGAP